MNRIFYVLFMPLALSACIVAAWDAQSDGSYPVAIMFCIYAAACLWIWCIEVRELLRRFNSK